MMLMLVQMMIIMYASVASVPVAENYNIYTLGHLKRRFSIMPRHKGEDYKISAVQYFLENDVSYSKTCEIFKCSERSLKRWINRYKEEGGIKKKEV
jgi:DNA invertase Pin-like site-specific DNA recombinase